MSPCEAGVFTLPEEREGSRARGGEELDVCMEYTRLEK